MPVDETYQPAVDYRLYRHIHKCQRLHAHVASEMQNMRKIPSIQVKDQVFSGKYSIYVIKCLTEVKKS